MKRLASIPKRLLGLAALAIAIGTAAPGSAESTTEGPAAAPPGTVGDLSAVGSQFDEFTFARAAAEVCLGVALSEPEQDHFIQFLAIRDPQRLPSAELADHVRGRLDEWRGAVARSGCHAAAVQRALTTWTLRVSTLAGIDGRAPPAVEGADIDLLGSGAASGLVGTPAPNG